MDTLILDRENKISLFSSLSIQKTPSYTVGSIDMKSGSHVAQDIYKIREKIVFGLMAGVVVVYRENNIVIRFNELVSQIEQDCLLASSPSQIALHPAYQEMIGMGKIIMPLLIEKLDESPTFWFWALQAISGANPVPKSHRGNVPQMVIDWKLWFNEKKYGKG